MSRYVASVGTFGSRNGREVVGTGRAIRDPGTARTVALAEAAERYAGLEPGAADGYTWARSSDLKGLVLDSTLLPRCSDAEYSAPGCPLTPFDADAVIRWSRGVELSSGEPVWVPSVMAVYGLPGRVPAERFWHSISTGYAVHTDPHAALCAAIREVIERDIIEILWSQRLPLPPVAASQLSARCRELLGWASDHFVTFFLFDATSDMTVPTAYCVQVAGHDQRVRQLVSCATGATLRAAAEKAALDGIGLRDMFSRQGGPVKTDPRDFTGIEDGARFMALAGQAPAFDFLVAGHADRIPADRPGLPENPVDQLATLIDVLEDSGMQAIAVDRTNNALTAAGLTAVCVIIPGLQPMTLHPLARFRAHPRLYLAPSRMGYQPLPEAELNPWPQPFA